MSVFHRLLPLWLINIACSLQRRRTQTLSSYQAQDRAGTSTPRITRTGMPGCKPLRARSLLLCNCVKVEIRLVRPWYRKSHHLTLPMTENTDLISVSICVWSSLGEAARVKRWHYKRFAMPKETICVWIVTLHVSFLLLLANHTNGPIIVYRVMLCSCLLLYELEVIHFALFHQIPPGQV